MPSSPSTSMAAETARSLPTDERREHEQLRSIGQELVLGRGHPRRAEVDEERSSHRNARPSRFRIHPSRARRPARGARRGAATIHAADGRRSRRWRAVRSGRPSAWSTRNASPSATSPAATTGSTGTPPRSASSVTNASCSTCQPAPAHGLRAAVPDRGPGRRHELAVPRVSAEDLHHERTAIGGRCERERDTARLQHRLAQVVASTPSSPRASDTCSRVRSPPGNQRAGASTPPPRTRCRNPRPRRSGASAPSAMLARDPERDQPPTDVTQWARQVRRRRHDHGRRHGDARGRGRSPATRS